MILLLCLVRALFKLHRPNIFKCVDNIYQNLFSYCRYLSQDRSTDIFTVDHNTKCLGNEYSGMLPKLFLSPYYRDDFLEIFIVSLIPRKWFQHSNLRDITSLKNRANCFVFLVLLALFQNLSNLMRKCTNATYFVSFGFRRGCMHKKVNDSVLDQWSLYNFIEEDIKESFRSLITLIGALVQTKTSFIILV